MAAGNSHRMFTNIQIVAALKRFLRKYIRKMYLNNVDYKEEWVIHYALLYQIFK